MRSMTFFATVAIAAAAIAAVPASAVSYDVASSYNGTNTAGAFSFGYIDAALTTFTLFNPGTPLENGQLSVLVGPELALGTYKNISGSAFTAFGTVDVPVDALFVHPGPTLLSAIVFTVPTTGNYTFNFFGKLLSNSVITGTQLYSGSLVGNTVNDIQPGPALTALNPTYAEIGTQPFTAGDRLFVAVGPAGDFSYDSTQINFTLSSAVPEPASWALLIAGFGLVGAAQRRRRPAAIAA